jgi:hypothetical protein
MIISYTYKYLFIEVPHTGSDAISSELRTHYGGTPILRKHAYYTEFLSIANPKETEYAVLSGIRNPLDETVALYHRYGDNPDGIYTDPRNMRDQGGWLTPADQTQFQYIQDQDPDFASFFLKFYTRPYTNTSSLSGNPPNFVIRFEHLQEDFGRALALLGIEQRRPLPCPEQNEDKARDFRSYYTPECYERAKRVFGPFMNKWGYKFPRQWGIASLHWTSKVHFELRDALKRFYWTRLKWGNTCYARAFRSLWLRPNQRETSRPHSPDRAKT